MGKKGEKVEIFRETLGLALPIRLHPLALCIQLVEGRP